MQHAPCAHSPHGLVHGGHNLRRSFARITQQTEDAKAHGQLVITTLKLHKQPAVALVQQNCQCLSVAEKVPVCISDGF